MKIFITIPSFSLNGGIRIVVEWANRLSEHHEVFLYSLKGDQCNYFKLSPNVKITRNEAMFENCDRMIITSPHAIHFEDAPRAPKTFLFLQMLESFFQPHNLTWQKKCKKMYTSRNPMFSISKWNIAYMKKLGRTAPTHYISNGINFNDFPIERPKKDGKTVLVEGVVPGNPTKDHEGIAIKVAAKLKEEGYTILGYSQYDRPVTDIFDEYVSRPSLEKMNDLYRRASVLIKATHMDARALAPLEAMTKGCVTARAITWGDDDLIDEVNCLRCLYHEKSLYDNTKKLLTLVNFREQLAENGYKHLKKNCDWDKVINGVNEIIDG